MKKQLLHYYGFLLGTMVMGITIQFLLPWPYGFITVLAIVLGFPIFLRYVAGKKLRDSGIYTGFNDIKAKKKCMVCGKQTGNSECPRCGSKQFHYE